MLKYIFISYVCGFICVIEVGELEIVWGHFKTYCIVGGYIIFSVCESMIFI
jgi:hypothetical protein